MKFLSLFLVVILDVLFAVNVAAADSPSVFFAPMTFVFEQTDLRPLGMGLRQTVYAQGEIVPGTAERFLAFLNKNKILPGELVVLNSPGGSLIDGMEIGQIIRHQELDTEVGVQGHDGGGCYSSCTLAFLGGVWRYVPSTAQFGVHQFSSSADLTSNEAFNASQEISGQILNYITSMGVSPKFFSEMSVSEPGEINILSQGTLNDLNVITPQYTTTWHLTAIPEGVYFKGTVKNIRGTHKFIFLCPQSGNTYPVLMVFMEADADSQLVADSTDTEDLVFDGREVQIMENEIVQRPSVSKGDVLLEILLTPRLVDQLRGAETLGVELWPLSRMMFSGFTANLTGGKEQLFKFLNSCGHS